MPSGATMMSICALARSKPLCTRSSASLAEAASVCRSRARIRTDAARDLVDVLDLVAVVGGDAEMIGAEQLERIDGGTGRPRGSGRRAALGLRRAAWRTWAAVLPALRRRTLGC